MTTFSDLDDEETLDILESVQEMRENHGELDFVPPDALLPDVQRRLQRSLEHHIRDLRQFGYHLQVRRDHLQRITRVRLLDQ